MGKLQKLQCDQCGGRIDGTTLACQSCGMQYRLNEDFTLGRVEVYHGRFTSIGGCIAVPAYVLNTLGPEEACEMSLKQMAENMADKILPFMEFQSMLDPAQNELVTYGRVKVAEPIVRYDGIREFVRDVIDHYDRSLKL